MSFHLLENRVVLTKLSQNTETSILALTLMLLHRKTWVSSLLSPASVCTSVKYWTTLQSSFDIDKSNNEHGWSPLHFSTVQRTSQETHLNLSHDQNNCTNWEADWIKLIATKKSQGRFSWLQHNDTLMQVYCFQTAPGQTALTWCPMFLHINPWQPFPEPHFQGPSVPKPFSQ